MIFLLDVWLLNVKLLHGLEALSNKRPVTEQYLRSSLAFYILIHPSFSL